MGEPSTHFIFSCWHQKIDIKNAAGAVLQLPPDSTYLLKYYTLHHAEIGITTVVSSQIKPLLNIA
jgi:hypothetical protein